MTAARMATIEAAEAVLRSVKMAIEHGAALSERGGAPLTECDFRAVCDTLKEFQAAKKSEMVRPNPPKRRAIVQRGNVVTGAFPAKLRRRGRQKGGAS